MYRTFLKILLWFQEEEEYEDIAVAESQDIAHRQLYPNGDQSFDHPRTRPRRKRRRRLRKRPRSTTPSFIEDYSPERTVKEEEPLPANEDEVVYRRRAPKRRRRPMRRKPEYDPENTELESPSEPVDENPPEGYNRPRSTMRRRRKNGRKRMRVTTELNAENNNTNEGTIGEVTTQPSEVVMQSNSYHLEQKESSEIADQTYYDVTTASVLSTGFTPKEITEINHELESISERVKNSDDTHHPESGVISLLKSSSEDSTTQQPEGAHEVASSTKDYSWISRFDPQTPPKTTPEENSRKEIKFESKAEKQEEINIKPQKNIKNIEKIIENRKNLFSKSNRLPPTSAVIRRNLRPGKNTTTTQEPVSDNIIPTTNQEHLEKEESTCNSIECALNKTTLSNNIIPSALLPSGFPTMPEILTTADIIKKISRKHKESPEKLIDKKHPEVIHQSDDNIIIITPSTLTRNRKNEDTNLFQADDSKAGNQDNIQQPSNSDSTFFEQSDDDMKENKFIKGVTTAEFSSSTVKEIKSTNFYSEEISLKPGTERHARNKPEILTLDGVDVTNINDEILELIMDEMGKARVKRILELRNMTLSELIAHRERGAGHFSDVMHENTSISQSEHNETASSTEIEDFSMKEDSMDEEKTETMIVEKAKQFMDKFKKTDESFSSVMRIKKGEKEQFGQKIKVEGTVIPVPILEPTHTSSIEFPEESVLGDFPKYMYDISGKRSKPNQPNLNDKPSLFREPINKPKDLDQSNDKREPRVFESMPKFSSETSSKDDLELYPYPDWRIVASKSTEKPIGFPGISREIMLVATSTSKSVSKHANIEDVVLLNEGEEARPLRNHILGGKINIDNIESEDATDEDYPEPKKIPASVKSAIAASGALLGLAIFGFLAVLVSCKIRQRRARLRARRDILCEHLAEDFRSSQRSHTPVLRKSPFNNNIHSNTASNRHYYLWRTLRKTFQYE